MSTPTRRSILGAGLFGLAHLLIPNTARARCGRHTVAWGRPRFRLFGGCGCRGQVVYPTVPRPPNCTEGTNLTGIPLPRDGSDVIATIYGRFKDENEANYTVTFEDNKGNGIWQTVMVREVTLATDTTSGKIDVLVRITKPSGASSAGAIVTTIQYAGDVVMGCIFRPIGPEPITYSV